MHSLAIGAIFKNESHYRVRTLAEFDELDKNEVEDLRLVEQNSRMYLNTT